MVKYKHTQNGQVMIFSFLAGILITGFPMIFQEYNPGLLLPMIVFLICLALFYQLTVTIGEDFLEIQFGVGLIRKKFLLSDIAECRAVSNHWFDGWGIHMTRHGWLYNVSGYDAVEIVTKSGRKYRIGTDVPAELEQSIRSAISFKS